LQPLWHDLNVSKRLNMANASRQGTIAAYRERLDASA
jgi:hypothetical protein